MKNSMQKMSTYILLSAVALSAAPPAFAAWPWQRTQEIRREVREEVQETRKDMIEARKEFREDIRTIIGSREAMLKSAKRWGRAVIANAKVTAKDGTTLTIEKDGKTLVIFTDDKTQFRRRFWGKSSLDEILVGHMVNVIGTWVDEQKTTIQARLVRDLSIQKRYGVFFGVVQSLTNTGWVMTTVSGIRENQTVTVSSATKFVNRRGGTITQGDIAIGHRVRVKGLWDRVNNTITQVTHVKNFTLPPFPTISVTATPTP